MVFCFEAGTKKEFRQRLQKTIHVSDRHHEMNICIPGPIQRTHCAPQSLQAQYREVWELRASLEEHGDFSDLPSSPEPESAAGKLINVAAGYQVPNITTV